MKRNLSIALFVTSLCLIVAGAAYAGSGEDSGGPYHLCFDEDAQQ